MALAVLMLIKLGEECAHRCHVDGRGAREDEFCVLEEAALLPVPHNRDAAVCVSIMSMEKLRMHGGMTE